MGADVSTLFTYTYPNQKFIDADLASNGKIYANTYGAHGHLIIDPSDGSADKVTLSTGADISYAMQTRGGCEIGGIFYSLSFIGGAPIRTIDTLTDYYGGNIVVATDTTGPFYVGRPNWELEGGLGVYDRHWGLIDGGNNKAYGIPLSSDRIVILDTVAGTTSRGADTLSGNEPLPLGTDPIPDPSNSPYLIKYSGGTLSSYNSCIYSMPRHARSVLKINTVDDSATEIPFPTTLMDTIAASGWEDMAFSLGSVEGADGRIYGTLWQAPIILWVDPISDEIGWIDMSPYTSLTGSTSNFYAYARPVGDSIYFSPTAANYVMKMTLTNIGSPYSASFDSLGSAKSYSM